MSVVIWIAEGTWPACVDAAHSFAPPGADIVLLHVTGDDVAAAARGAYRGLLGRGHPERDPGVRLEAMAAAAGSELLDAAQDRLGRSAGRVECVERHGRIEREVVHAADGAELLIAARDGDRTRLGPHSLGPVTRFVVDHAPCPVLLVWPEQAPGIGSIPPPPHEHHGHR